MSRKKTPHGDATATDRAPRSLAQPAPVTGNDVAHHAYALYRARGGEHGHDVEDWLQAEHELQSDPER